MHECQEIRSANINQKEDRFLIYERDLMNPKEMSGLALLEAMRDEKIPAPSISETMSMQPAVIESGRVEFKVKADHRHLNPLGGVHGGFAATVLDTVTGCAIHTLLEAGVGYGTIDLNVKMCRPIPQNPRRMPS